MMVTFIYLSKNVMKINKEKLFQQENEKIIFTIMTDTLL